MSKYSDRECKYLECDIVFTPLKHNQMYCCAEHVVLENNRKGMEKYRERRKNPPGSPRVCSNESCEHRLSRYNKGTMCVSCEVRQKDLIRDQLLEALNGHK